MKITYKDSGILKHYSIDEELKLVHELEKDEVIIRFWQVEAVLLGKLDTVLPKYEEGKQFLIDNGYKVEIRKQGGLAIVSDCDNLNMTFCFKASDFKDLHKPYQCVAKYIVDVLSEMGLKVDIKSIDDSYCPGDYDLSVNGVKFAGIAQYRNKEAIIVGVSLFVKGDQSKRSQLIKDFYDITEARNSTRQNYPVIDIESMGTLSDFLEESLDIDVVKNVFMASNIHICE